MAYESAALLGCVRICCAGAAFARLPDVVSAWDDMVVGGAPLQSKVGTSLIADRLLRQVVALAS